MRFIFILYLLLLHTLLSAQVIDYRPKPIEVLQPSFTTDYITSNKIFSIRVEVSSKTESGRIKDKGIKYDYFFDKEGKIIKKVMISEITDDIGDTATTHYFYKDKNLSIARTYSAKKYNTNYYEYDSKNNLIRHVNCNETNINETHDVFKLGQQTIQYLETYSYEELSKSQTHKKFYNDLGKVFKEGIIHHDKKDRVIEENIKFSFTGIRINNKYLYDDENNVREKTYYSDASGELYETIKISYDNKNKPMQEQFYRNDKLINETFLFYDKENKLLEATITKNPDDKSMLLKKLSYQFYQ